MMDGIEAANAYCKDRLNRLAELITKDPERETLDKFELSKAIGIPERQIVNGIKNGNLHIGWSHASSPTTNKSVTIDKTLAWIFFTNGEGAKLIRNS